MSALLGKDGAVLLDRLEVAQGRRAKRRGLLGRDGLAGDEGLLLERCRMVHTFGMRFAIGLIFLDKNGRVVRIVRSLVPGRLSACLRARDVLECGAGSPLLDVVRTWDELTIEREQ